MKEPTTNIAINNPESPLIDVNPQRKHRPSDKEQYKYIQHNRQELYPGKIIQQIENKLNAEIINKKLNKLWKINADWESTLKNLSNGIHKSNPFDATKTHEHKIRINLINKSLKPCI